MVHVHSSTDARNARNEPSDYASRTNVSSSAAYSNGYAAASTFDYSWRDSSRQRTNKVVQKTKTFESTSICRPQFVAIINCLIVWNFSSSIIYPEMEHAVSTSAQFNLTHGLSVKLYPKCWIITTPSISNRELRQTSKVYRWRSLPQIIMVVSEENLENWQPIFQTVHQCARRILEMSLIKSNSSEILYSPTTGLPLQLRKSTQERNIKSCTPNLQTLCTCMKKNRSVVLILILITLTVLIVMDLLPSHLFSIPSQSPPKKLSKNLFPGNEYDKSCWNCGKTGHSFKNAMI